jgi:uncharacterized protein YdhG (YjbR/CyaY superfamily)
MSEIDSYLADAPEPQRTALSELREILSNLLPDADEGLSYGVPAFKINGSPVAGFAYAKNHCSYFPHSGSVLEQVEAKLLDGYDWSKGTLRFPADSVPEEKLIQRLIELRRAQMEPT